MSVYTDRIRADGAANLWRMGPAGAEPPSGAVPWTDGFVYRDGALYNGFADGSSNSTVSLSATNPATTDRFQYRVYRTRGVSWTTSVGFARLRFARSGGFDLSPYSHLCFRVRAGAANQGFVVLVQSTAGAQLGVYKAIPNPQSSVIEFGGLRLYAIDLAADLGLTRPFPTIGAVVFEDATGLARSAASYFSEIRFARTRARFVPNHANVYPENRPLNQVMNFAPLFEKPTQNPYAPGGSRHGFGWDGFAPYWDLVDGNCAGTTEEILEWAARKWGWAIGTVDPISGNGPPSSGIAGDGGGVFADLIKAQAVRESRWAGEYLSDPSDLGGGLYGWDSSGVGQQRGRFYPPYELEDISTAFSADYKAALNRAIYNGDTYHAGQANPPTGNIRLTLEAYFAGNTGGGSNATYPCAILGGTSSQDGAYYPGFINTKPWLDRNWPTVPSGSFLPRVP